MFFFILCVPLLLFMGLVGWDECFIFWSLDYEIWNGMSHFYLFLSIKIGNFDELASFWVASSVLFFSSVLRIFCCIPCFLLFFFPLYFKRKYCNMLILITLWSFVTVLRLCSNRWGVGIFWLLSCLNTSINDMLWTYLW